MSTIKMRLCPGPKTANLSLSPGQPIKVSYMSLHMPSIWCSTSNFHHYISYTYIFSDPPRIRSSGGIVTGRAGDNVKLPCDVDDQDAFVSWSKDGESITIAWPTHQRLSYFTSYALYLFFYISFSSLYLPRIYLCRPTPHSFCGRHRDGACG